MVMAKGTSGNGSATATVAAKVAPYAFKLTASESQKMNAKQYAELRTKVQSRQVHLQGQQQRSVLADAFYLADVHIHTLKEKYVKTFKYYTVHYEGPDGAELVTVWVSEQPKGDYAGACRDTMAAMKRAGIAFAQKRVGVYQVNGMVKAPSTPKPQAASPVAETAPAVEPEPVPTLTTDTI
jgi:hypothetical protein